MLTFSLSLLFDAFLRRLPRSLSNLCTLFLLLVLYVSLVYLSYTLYSGGSRIAMGKKVPQKVLQSRKTSGHHSGGPKRFERALSVADRAIILQRPPRMRKMTRAEQARVRYAYRRGLSVKFLARPFATNDAVIRRIVSGQYDRHSISSQEAMWKADRELCDEVFVSIVKREVKVRCRRRTNSRIQGDRHAIGSWRIIPDSSSAMSASSQGQPASSASRGAGPSSARRAAPVRRAVRRRSVFSSDSDGQFDDSDEEAETEDSGAESEFELESNEEDSKEDLKLVEQVLADTETHVTITTAWLMDRAGLSGRQDLIAQMSYMGFTDKHAVLLAEQTNEQLLETIGTIFPKERFGQQYTFALNMFFQACVAARAELKRS
ncbi:hypothetical protein HDZ31DRAFT_42692 [Schizophyllum fasciatum]